MNRRILIVDDNTSIHEDFQKILGSAGVEGLADLDQLELEILELSDAHDEQALYSLEYALGGQQALQMLVDSRKAGQPFAMAFVDMRMPPGWDGLETIERMWQEDPGLQVVICTAYSDYSWDELEARVQSADNLFLLSKPFDMMEIRQAAAAMTLKRHLAEATCAQIDSLEETLEQSREELQEANQRLKAILEAAPVGILTTDADFVIQGLNRLAQELFGPASEKVGQPLGSLLTKSQPGPGNHVCSGVRADGTSFPAQLKVSQLELHSGLVHICIVIDLTESRRTELERQRLERQLYHSQKLESLGILAGGVAHDFNNMLMAITGYAEAALLDSPAQGPLRDTIVNIKATALRAAAVAQQMLSYAGKTNCAVERLSLNDILQSSAHPLKVTVPAHITWNLDLADKLPMVEADPGLMQQVIVNLVMNAVEAIGSEKGSITLSTGVKGLSRAFLASTYLPQAEPGSYLYVACKDSGSGIDSDLTGRVFDPFYTTKSQGRGLGLSSVLGIVKVHGGTLHVESSPGQGSTFWAYFPVSHLPSVERPVRQVLSLVGGKILVVDDQDAVRDATQGLVRRLGFEVLTASDGDQAVKICQQNGEDLVAVLMDVSMPTMGGNSAADEIGEQCPDLPIIMMSGYTGEQSQTKSGPFLHKPITLDTLSEALQSVLNPSAEGDASREPAPPTSA